MTDILLPDGSVWRDDGSGTWLHIPDVDTANAMGVDWNALDVEDSLPGPAGGDWPSVDGGGGAGGGGGDSGGGSAGDSGGGGGGDSGGAASPPTNVDVIDPAGNVYSWYAGGFWRRMPDVITANAMGVNWPGLVSVTAAPQPLGDDWPSVDASASAAAASAELVSEHGQGGGTGGNDVGAIPGGTTGGSSGGGAAGGGSGAPAPPTGGILGALTAAQLASEAAAEQAQLDASYTPQLTFSVIQQVEGPSGGFTLPAVSGGKVTAKGAWASLVQALAGPVSNNVQAARSVAKGITRAVGLP